MVYGRENRKRCGRKLIVVRIVNWGIKKFGYVLSDKILETLFRIVTWFEVQSLSLELCIIPPTLTPGRSENFMTHYLVLRSGLRVGHILHDKKKKDLCFFSCHHFLNMWMNKSQLFLTETHRKIHRLISIFLCMHTSIFLANPHLSFQ